jgi:type IV pilus assembly protein PilX
MAYVTHTPTQQKQKGVVLITALIMVIAVTGIAVTLMSSSTIDIKITNAAQEREVAENMLVGEVQRVIAQEANKGSASQFFLTKNEIPEQWKTIATHDGMQSAMTNLNKGVMELNCPRRYNPTEGVVCNMMQVTTTIEYGSKSKHQLTVVTGIAQEMANKGKGI